METIEYFNKPPSWMLKAKRNRKKKERKKKNRKIHNHTQERPDTLTAIIYYNISEMFSEPHGGRYIFVLCIMFTVLNLLTMLISIRLVVIWQPRVRSQFFVETSFLAVWFVGIDNLDSPSI
jgi:hypothetical protein